MNDDSTDWEVLGDCPYCRQYTEWKDSGDGEVYLCQQCDAAFTYDPGIREWKEA